MGDFFKGVYCQWKIGVCFDLHPSQNSPLFFTERKLRPPDIEIEATGPTSQECSIAKLYFLDRILLWSVVTFKSLPGVAGFCPDGGSVRRIAKAKTYDVCHLHIYWTENLYEKPDRNVQSKLYFIWFVVDLLYIDYELYKDKKPRCR